MRIFYLLMLLLFFLASPGLKAQQTFQTRIVDDLDDVEEALAGSTNPEGQIDAGSSDLELGNESADGSRPQMIGLRFQNVTIPQAAIITNARIVFTVDATNKNTDPCEVVIKMQDIGDAPAFSTAAFDVSSRATLAESVNWTVPAGTWNTVGEAGPDQTTPDLSGLVQQIVDQAAWTAGNSMVFTIAGTGVREAESFGSPDLAPMLVIDYIPAVGLTARINDSAADAEEHLSDGRMDVTSSDLELGSEDADNSDPQAVGLVFTGLDIPAGVVITAASIQFFNDDENKNVSPASLIIEAQADPNPGLFTSTNGDITGRGTLAPSVTWTVENEWDGASAPFAGGNDQRTPDLSGLVQAAIDQDGWIAGNNIAFILSGQGTRTAASYDNDPTASAILSVNYVLTETVTARISDSSHDAEEHLNDGGMDVSSSDLELGSEDSGNSDPQAVGLLFTGIDIPKGAPIKNAYIQFFNDTENKNVSPANLVIKAQSGATPAAFSSTAGDISSRPTLPESVNWSVANEWDGASAPFFGGTDQQTPDLSALVEAIVNQDDWAAGSDMAFIISGEGTRTAASYDNEPTAAAQLIVEVLSEPADDAVAAPFDLFHLGSYATGIFDEGAAEIVAYDKINQQVFATNADAKSVSIISVSSPRNPSLIRNIDVSGLGDGVTSVAVANELVAIAIEGPNSTDPGSVLFTDLKGDSLHLVTVGVLPDMITFNRAGDKVLTANEGEPNDDYTLDPEGSISIIDISGGVTSATVATADFTAFNSQEAALKAAGVRIFGPGASVAQDLEPEYITVLPGDATAVVSLQENNAVAVVDIATASVTAVLPLGYKDHSLDGNGFDANNTIDSIDIRTHPTLGMYQPDAIKSVEIGGVTYLVTANEGDARDYDGFSEEARVEDLTLDPTAYPDADSLQQEANLGRLNTTTATGDTDGDGDIDQIYSYGTRSFSIWDAATGALIWDSGDMLEQMTAALEPDNFNSNNDENDSFKSRSDDKGPEPEAIEIVELYGNVFALVGLERIGGIMVFDITDPTAPLFSNYVNNRDFSVMDVETELAEVGDLGVEDIVFVPADASPTGSPMVITANEVSGTVSLFSVNDPFPAAEFSLRIVHNNDGESKLLPAEIDGMMVGGAAEFKTVADSIRKSDNLPSITLSSGDNFLAGTAFDASLALPESEPIYDAVVMDSIGYDAVAIGNHDFDFGPDILERFIKSYQITQPPYLSANMDFSGEPGLQALADAGRIAPRTIVDVNGEKVGVIGLIYDRVASITSPRNVTVSMAPYEMIVSAQVNALKAEGVNKIILISHLQSINREMELAGNLTDIDVIIAGGGDELLTNDPSIALQGAEVFGEYPLKVKDAAGKTTYIVTTPGEYKYVGNLELAFDENGEIFAVGDQSNPILVADVAPDPTLEMIQDSIIAFEESLAVTKVAFTEVAMDGTRGAKRRFETNQGNLVADAYLWLTRKNAPDLDPDFPLVAVQNSGGMRLDEVIPANSDITIKTVRDIMAFNNDMVLMEPLSPQLFRDMLENSVSAVEDTDGRFLQVGGFSFVWDTLGLPGFGRVQSAMLDDGTMMIDNYEVVDGAPSVYVVTNNFSAGLAGPVGDDFDEFRQVDLKANLGSSYFRAVLDYITAEDGLDSLITAAQYPEGGEGRIIRTGPPVLFGDDSEKDFTLIPIGTFETGIFDEGAAEIVAHDPGTQRLFFTNADANTVTILDISNPSAPAKVADIAMDPYGGGVNSVDVANGVVAVAVESNDKTSNGTVVFTDIDGTLISTVEVGALPDMVTFTPDGTKVLVANEGEPDDDYLVDPEGSVSVIDISAGADMATVSQITFESLNADSTALRAAGVRIYGPGASVAQDLEPEYIAVTEDGTIAVVVLQENNAIARIDLTTNSLIDVLPLGYKNHALAFNGLDASDRSADIDIKPQPLLGMYQPDAIKSVNIGGVDYFVTANEGDARDYDAYSEETRVEDLFLYSFDYPDFVQLKSDTVLGRMKTTLTSPEKSITTIAGQTISGLSPILSYGARSFSIWDANGELIFDSGDFIERKLAELVPDEFNSNNDENGSKKSRSDDKGPEPEAIEIARFDGSVFALVGLERIGGVMVFDITDPTAPAYVSYQNNREFSVADVETNLSAALDLGIEDIRFVDLDNSPVDVPLVLTANEVSGTVTIFAVNSMPTATRDLLNLANFDFTVGPNPFVSNFRLSYELNDASKVAINLMDVNGRFVKNVVAANQPSGVFNFDIDAGDLVAGTYYLLIRVNNRVAALPVVKQ